MEEKTYDFIIGKDEKPERIDIFLSSKIGMSRNMMQKLIEGKMVLVNNSTVKSNYKLKYNDNINLKVPEPKQSLVIPQNIPLKIVYDDKDIVVINKPAGMIVHPTTANKTDTLVNALLYSIKDLSSIGGELKPGIVHRLDKDTSGLLVVAKNDNAHLNLQKQIMDRTVKKVYLALVFGRIKPQSGIIEKPIGRHPIHRNKMAVILDSKFKSRQATTAYRSVKEYKGYSLLELDLKTGRTHQIRVHLSHLGYPIVGDRMYTRKKDDLGAGRQLLHAHILGFKHPVTGQYLEFKADMPDDFRLIIEKLEKRDR